MYEQRKTYKTIKDTVVEELFIFLENKEIYIVPIEEIKNKSTLTICSKYKEYKVDF